MTNGDTLLLVNTVLTAACCGGLMWRLIGRWPLSSWLSRLVIILFAVLELIVAVLAAREIQFSGSVNEAQYALTIHSLVVLGVIVVWARLLDPTGQRL